MHHHISIEDLNVWYGTHHVLKDIQVDIPKMGITAIIGPSGCGKTTLLRSLNRLLEEDPTVHITGKVLIGGKNIYDSAADLFEVRTRIGLLASKPFPLPMSIYDNVAYGPRLHGRYRRHSLDLVVEHNLRAAGLWEEVSQRLKTPAAQLSTGQQQRLCLARALSVRPEVLLCDEATSALDPFSAQRVETQLQELKKDTTVVMVTHMLRQARRLADYLVFLWLGELVEAGAADDIFNEPRDPRTQAYLMGDIG